jgi:hypothetical protein
MYPYDNDAMGDFSHKPAEVYVEKPPALYWNATSEEIKLILRDLYNMNN